MAVNFFVEMYIPKVTQILTQLEMDQLGEPLDLADVGEASLGEHLQLSLSRNLIKQLPNLELAEKSKPKLMKHFLSKFVTTWS